jgi:hypothetical protein
MVEHKTNSQVLILDGVVGTSGKAGYLHAITVIGSGAAGTAAIHDGTGVTDTEKWRIGVSAANNSVSISGLNIYCASGIYLNLTTAFVSVEYSGAT